MAKKKRKRARKASSTTAPKKRRRSKKRRAASSTAPKRRRRRSAAPKRRRARRASARAPKRRRRRAHASVAPRRHHRRSAHRKGRRTVKVRSYRRRRGNPGIPLWATVGLAGLAGLASFALYGAGSFALTQRIDPSMASLERNRYIAGGIATVLGGAVALLASPVIGAGLLAGGLVSLVGTDLYLALGKVLDKAPAASPSAPTPQVKGLYRGGQQQFGALQQGGRQILGIGGLYRAGQQQFGDIWAPAYQ